MNFRDKLARLTSPMSRAGSSPAGAGEAAIDAAVGERRIVVDPEFDVAAEPGDIVRVMQRLADEAVRGRTLDTIPRNSDAVVSMESVSPSAVQGTNTNTNVSLRRFGARASDHRDALSGGGSPLMASDGAHADSERDAAPHVRASRDDAETDAARAERISHLRNLIGDVLARGSAWRSPRESSAAARAAFAGGRDIAGTTTSGRATANSPPDDATSTDTLSALDADARPRAGGGPRTSRRTRETLMAVIAGAERASAEAEPMSTEALRANARFDIDAPVAPLEPEARIPGARLHMLRAAIDGWAPARARLPRVFARQPWATRETPHGPVHVVERWLEPRHLHGTASVHSALERLPATLAALALDPALADLDLSRMLFLDTETTGLAGGSGTVAFLVGLARFHDDALLCTQLLLPNLGGEVPMLIALAEHLAAASCVLTYNGKTFDWPLLRTRYVMNRLSIPVLPPHVDLLHASRRIWKPRLGSVRLADVEREIMRFSREDDIDGAEIPSRYFSFLRDGGSEWLLPVLEHNQNDVIALPALLGALGERFEQIDCGEHGLDALAYGRLALRVADGARAAAFARAAIVASEGSPLESHAWSFCGDVARRSRETVAAAQHFESALALCSEPPRRAVLHVTLAKLYEHALRDLPGAYRHARCTEPAEGPELHGRRLGRLTRKLERQAIRSLAVRR